MKRNCVMAMVIAMALTACGCFRRRTDNGHSPYPLKYVHKLGL